MKRTLSQGFMINKLCFSMKTMHYQRNCETLFCLLLQHCSDNIQNQINHSAGNKASYQQAKQKLKTEYGSPWIISDACYQKLKRLPERWRKSTIKIYNVFENF